MLRFTFTVVNPSVHVDEQAVITPLVILHVHSVAVYVIAADVVLIVLKAVITCQFMTTSNLHTEVTTGYTVMVGCHLA